MIIKMAFKELEVRKNLYTFIILQLTAVFLIGISFVSVMEMEYVKYHAFKSYLSKEGWYIYGGNVDTPDNYPVRDSTMLEEYLASTDVLACYSLSGELQKEEELVKAEPIIYDQAIIDAYEPAIKEGRWLENADIQTNVVEAVIAPNSYALGLGDRLTIREYGAEPEEDPVIVEIVGVLAEDAEFYNISFTKNMITYKNLYDSVARGKRDMPLLIMGSEDIRETEYGMKGKSELLMIQGTVLLTWKEGITEEEKAKNITYMTDHCFIAQKEELASVYLKSREEIKGEMQKYIPVLSCGLALTIISSLCVGMIASKRQWKRLSVYNMLGLSWNRCIRIQMAAYLIIDGISLGTAFLIAGLLKLFHITDYTAIRVGLPQFMFCVGIFLLCSGVITVQNALLKKEPPYRLWKKE